MMRIKELKTDHVICVPVSRQWNTLHEFNKKEHTYYPETPFFCSLHLNNFYLLIHCLNRLSQNEGNKSFANNSHLKFKSYFEGKYIFRFFRTLGVT